MPPDEYANVSVSYTHYLTIPSAITNLVTLIILLARMAHCQQLISMHGAPKTSLHNVGAIYLSIYWSNKKISDRYEILAGILKLL